MESTIESAATLKFKYELINLLAQKIGFQGPAIEKVAEDTIKEAKRMTEKNNLDDLNDVAKQFFFSAYK
jgi:hypothetical protein